MRTVDFFMPSGLSPEGTYSIVALGEKDAPDLAALEAECFAMPWSEERYRDILSAVDRFRSGTTLPRDRFPPFMAFGLREKDETLAAYVSLGLYYAARELEVYNIAVRQSRRRRGYGAALLGGVLEAAMRAGFTRAVLEVRASNTPALALYAGAGFLECGRRKGYYADTGEDARVLCLDFSHQTGPEGGPSGY